MTIARPLIARGWTAGLAAFAFMAAGCRGGGDATPADATPVVAVQTTSVQLAPFVPTVRAVGTVVSSPQGYAQLSSPAPSRVTRVFVTAGQHVHSGDALVALDAAPLAAAASGASAARDAAQRAYDRATDLSRQGILPRKSVDQAAADLAQANAAAVAARHTFALSTLHSPISGVVTQMNAVTGASVDVSQILVAVADPSSLQILLQVSPGDAGSIRPGASVALFESDAPGAPSLGTGTVATVGAAVDSASRSVGVRVRLGSTSRPLRLGETVVGRIAMPGAPHAMAVPTAALVPDSAGTFKVYVVRNGVAVGTPVEIGTRGDSLVEITKGVAPGETIVTSGAYGLEDSSKVTTGAPSHGKAPKPNRR